MNARVMSETASAVITRRLPQNAPRRPFHRKRSSIYPPAEKQTDRPTEKRCWQTRRRTIQTSASGQAKRFRLSAGVQKETCCGYKRRHRSPGAKGEPRALRDLRLDDPGRACWRGRGESVTRWRPAATRAGTRKPVAAARPPSPTHGATTSIPV